MTTKERILKAAVDLAVQSSYRDLSRSLVARKANCSEALIAHHYGSMTGLRDALMSHAVTVDGLSVLVAQGVACNDPLALNASAHARKAATEFLRDA